jgi:hypothetical protein
MWDPGGVVMLLKVYLHWLEGKPKLKEGMLGPNLYIDGVTR